MRHLRLKSLGWIATLGVSGVGCAGVTRPDVDARGQLAGPLSVAVAWVPPTPPAPFDEPQPPMLELDPRDPMPMGFAGVIRVVPKPVVETLTVPTLTATELPKSLAIPLTIPELPPAEKPVPPRPIPDLMPPAEPVAPPLVHDEPVQGVPDVPAVGTVSVGGQPVSFDKLSTLIGAGEGRPGHATAGGCPSCGSAGGGCTKCEPVPTDRGLATRVVGRMYEALCCPDPCYQPKWIPLADTAFFTPSARPVSHTRLQWQYTRYGMFPDRGEYFWARADGNGKGPKPVAAIGIPRVDTHELSQYTETATGPGFSAYFVTPYRSTNPTFSDPSSAAGFGDMTIGTKSVLMDSELFLLTLQFQTTLPVGNAAKGLGTGHVALEPSLLFGLRVSPNSYLQGQIAEYIPLGGDPTYSGAMLHYHLAYNHLLWQPISQVQLIGTFEMHGYSWQDGGFTDPATGFRNASGSNILQLGPGVRLFYCDRYFQRWGSKSEFPPT